MNKFICIISFLVILESIKAKQTLLYYVTNEDQLNSIDKLNKISFLSNNNDKNNLSLAVEIFEDNDKLSEQAPKLYSLLYAHSDYILIGTKNKMLNISLDNVNSIKTKILSWPTSSINKNNKLKNKTECLTSKLSAFLQCQNYIRTAVPLNSNTFIVCATNSSQPYCRKYDLNSTLIEEFQSPQLFSLNKINKNNKFLFDTNSGVPAFSYSSDAIYYVNSGSFTQEPSINKQPFSKRGSVSSRLIKTPRGAIRQNANFRSTFGYKEKVYFFYSETELTDDTNGLTFKTYVGEVCANDNGRASFSDNTNRFITFKKSLIYCYLPDYKYEYHLKYTEIQAVTKPIRQENSTDTFYAIFTFRRVNTIDSALCKYKLDTVEKTMKGYFKSMEDHKDPIIYRKPLESCADYLKEQSNLNEYNKEMNKYYKFEMEQVISEPALFALNNVKFTSIQVDPASWKNNFNDVIFVGTEDGRVLKLIMNEIEINAKKYQQPILVQEYQLFESNKPIINLIIYNQSKLVAITDDSLKTIQLDLSCISYSTCAQCILSQDPYCQWSSENVKCESIKKSMNKNVFKTDLDKCNDLNKNDSDLKVLYQINYDNNNNNNNKEKDLTNTNQNQFDSSMYRKLDSINSNNNNNKSNNVVLAIFLTALITCSASVILTWLFIKKRYQMAEYVSKHMLQLSSGSQSESNRSSTSSYNNNYGGKKYLSNTNNTAPGMNQKQKNFYEKPNYIVAPDSPITSTTLTNMDSSESNQHSPNTNQLLTRSLNSALSSSDDSFDPPQPQIILQNNNNNRRMLYDSTRLNIVTNSDIINITTNLLSRKDSNV